MNQTLHQCRKTIINFAIHLDSQILVSMDEQTPESMVPIGLANPANIQSDVMYTFSSKEITTTNALLLASDRMLKLTKQIQQNIQSWIIEKYQNTHTQQSFCSLSLSFLNQEIPKFETKDQISKIQSKCLNLNSSSVEHIQDDQFVNISALDEQSLGTHNFNQYSTKKKNSLQNQLIKVNDSRIQNFQTEKNVAEKQLIINYINFQNCILPLYRFAVSQINSNKNSQIVHLNKDDEKNQNQDKIKNQLLDIAMIQENSQPTSTLNNMEQLSSFFQLNNLPESDEQKFQEMEQSLSEKNLSIGQNSLDIVKKLNIQQTVFLTSKQPNLQNNKSIEIILKDILQQRNYNMIKTNQSGSTESISIKNKYTNDHSRLSSKKSSQQSKQSSFDKSYKVRKKTNYLKNQKYDKYRATTKLASNGITGQFYSIRQLYQILKLKEDNIYYVSLNNYQSKTLEVPFRFQVMTYLSNQYQLFEAVQPLKVEYFFFQKNIPQFYIKKYESIFQPNFKQCYTLSLKNIQNQKIKLQNITPNHILSQRIQNIKSLNLKYKNYWNRSICQIIKTKVQADIKKSSELSKKTTNKLERQKIRKQRNIKILISKFYFRRLKKLNFHLCQYYEELTKKEQFILKKNYKMQLRLKEVLNRSKEKQKNKQNMKQQEEDLVYKIQRKMKELYELIEQLEEQLRSVVENSAFLKAFSNSQKNIQFLLDWEIELTQLVHNQFYFIKQQYQRHKSEINIPFYYQQSILFLLTQSEINELMQIILNTKQSGQKNKYFNQKEQINSNIQQIGEFMEEKNQTFLIFNTFIQNFIQDRSRSIKMQQKMQQSPKNKSNHEQKLYKQQKRLGVKKLFHFMLLYNYIMVCYSYHHKKQFNLRYYCLIADMKENNTYSKYQNKVYFFWKMYNNPSLLKRIYQESTQRFEELKHLQSQSNINLKLLYQYYIDDEQINQKVRYLIHLSQFFLQIVGDLSNSKFISMSILYNAASFLIIFFIFHFFIQMIKKIQKEIFQKNGQLYFNALISRLNTTRRWINCKQTFIQCYKSSSQKIQSYIKEFNNQKVKQSKSFTNKQKIGKIFKDHPKIKQIYDELKSKTFEDAWNQSYDFQIVKNAYHATITLMILEYSNRSFIQKILKRKVLKIEESVIKQQSKYKSQKKQFAHYVNFAQKEQINLNYLCKPRKGLQREDEYQFIWLKFAVFFLQTIKVVSMVLALPFYSKQNENENLRSKKYKTRQKSNSSILCLLDQFYIYQKKRMTSEYIRNAILQLQSPQIFQHQTDRSLELLNFLFNDDIDKKLKKIQQLPSLRIEGMQFKYPKFIQMDRMSIFQIDQCKELFFNLFTENWLDKKTREQFKQFYKFVDDFSKTGKQVLINCKSTKSFSGYSSQKQWKKEEVKQTINPRQELKNMAETTISNK